MSKPMGPNDPEFKHKIYLGDGVYGLWDGYQIWLITLEGHTIALEPKVMDALKSYEQHIIDVEFKGVPK